MPNVLDIENRSNIEKQIVGALRNTIIAHGSITEENISSASKRIYCTLKGIAREQRREFNFRKEKK